MFDFNWTTFTRRIAVRATIEEMYNAWTVPQELERWFLEKAIFRDQDGNELSRENSVCEGASYEWKWHAYDDTESGKMVNVNGSDFVQFTFAGPCLVDIRLNEWQDHVIVELTQKNIPTDDLSKREIRLGCHTGWSFFLVNLKSVYEGGLDLRNMNPDLTGMLNN